MPDHGMHGTSDSHCCYKHQFKDSVSDRPDDIVLDLLQQARDEATYNSFAAIDQVDAIEELLQERTNAST